jgi:alpha/beta superfamily hydrolase
MPAARRCLLLCLALALGSCGGSGAAGSRDTARIGRDVSFSVPQAPGSAQTIRLQGVERGRGPVGIVLAHMLGSSQAAWEPILNDLTDAGFHVLTFDFRGYGLSEGVRDPSRGAIDLGGAVAKIRSLGATRVLVAGASMGGTAAIVVAASADLGGVISISGPAQIGSLDAAAAVGKVREPTLFVVGKGDDARYTGAAQTLFAAAHEPKRIEVIDGTAAHGTDLLIDPTAGARVRKLILDFMIAHRG